MEEIKVTSLDWKLRGSRDGRQVCTQDPEAG